MNTLTHSQRYSTQIPWRSKTNMWKSHTPKGKVSQQTRKRACLNLLSDDHKMGWGNLRVESCFKGCSCRRNIYGTNYLLRQENYTLFFNIFFEFVKFGRGTIQWSGKKYMVNYYIAAQKMLIASENHWSLTNKWGFTTSLTRNTEKRQLIWSLLWIGANFQRKTRRTFVRSATI